MQRTSFNAMSLVRTAAARCRLRSHITSVVGRAWTVGLSDPQCVFASGSMRSGRDDIRHDLYPPGQLKEYRETIAEDDEVQELLQKIRKAGSKAGGGQSDAVTKESPGKQPQPQPVERDATREPRVGSHEQLDIPFSKYPGAYWGDRQRPEGSE